MQVWKSLALLALITTPASADPSGAIDYEALFAARADAVEEIMAVEGAQSRWRLRMPGGVVLYAEGTAQDRWFSGVDEGGVGAVGCLWSAYQDLATLALSCPSLLSPEQHEQLRLNFTRVGEFVADNTYPPVERAAFRAYWDGALAADPTLACDTVMNPAIQPIVETLLSPRASQILDPLLATPRLPVNNPCF